MPQPRPHKLLGVLWILGAIAVPGVALVFTLAVAQGIGAISNVFVIFILPVSIFMAKRGRRHFAKIGEHYLDRDPRPPVVFLREFGEERFILEDTSESSRGTFEQTLVDTFETLGPVVAIGRPEENLPPSGAIRLYVDDDHWQAKVAELIERSRLIVIQAKGRSQGMFWELDHVFKRVPFKPVMLAFPFQHVLSPRERYVDFRESLQKITGIQLPYETAQYIYFPSPDTPIPIPTPLFLVAQLAPEAFENRQRRHNRNSILLQISLAIFGAFLFLASVKADGDLRLWSAVILFFYGTAALTIVVLQKKWATPLVLALAAAYAVIASALFEDKLPGVSESDIFVFWGLTLAIPLLAILGQVYVNFGIRRKTKIAAGATAVPHPKRFSITALQFALIPIAALAAWLCVLAYVRAYPPATHLTDDQTLQLAPIQAKIYATASQNQCEQMLQDRIQLQRSAPVEDVLKNLGNEIDTYRSIQHLLGTLPKEDAATYSALRQSALSQPTVYEYGPSPAGAINDVAPKLTNPAEQASFNRNPPLPRSAPGRRPLRHPLLRPLTRLPPPRIQQGNEARHAPRPRHSVE
jgi:hypothetical protein